MNYKRACFGITRNGIDIREYPLSNPVNANIQYNIYYAEIDAAIAAGVDLWSWEMNIYPVWFKEKVIAWHRSNIAIKNHQEDALSRKLKHK